MALDSAAKRFSMMDMCRVNEPGIPPPDGAIGTADRLALLWLYSGIAAGVTGGLQRERFISVSKIRVGL